MSTIAPPRAWDRVLRSGAKRAVGELARHLVPARHDLPLSTWRLERLADGALALDGLDLNALLDQVGSPTHVVDAWSLASNARRFQAIPPGASRGCEVFYSYKTDPVPGVLRLLHSHGLGADAASDYELWLALRLGVDPTRIVFNGPTRSTESLTLAISRGVGLINLNSRGDIAPLAALAAGGPQRARVGLRVVPPGSVGGQFGERLDTGAALAAFREAVSCPALRVVALHAHNNTEISSREQLDAFLSPLLAFTDELRSQVGLELEVMDFGGNLACPSVSHLSERARRLAITLGCEPALRPPASVLSIDEYVARIIERVHGHYAARGHPPPRVFLEPGRAVTSNAQMLLCRVSGMREPDAEGLSWGVLDCGHNVAEPVTSELHQLIPLVARPNAPRRRYRLTGPNCTLADQLYPAWTMSELRPGDGLAIMDAGAYFVSFSTCFSRPRPGVVVVDHGRSSVLRRAETFDDLVALDEVRGPTRPTTLRSVTSLESARVMEEG